MQYIGGSCGQGQLRTPAGIDAPAEYDLEFFFDSRGLITACGEICGAPEILAGLFAERGVRLETDGGRSFPLSFSSGTLPDGAGAAHADILGSLTMDDVSLPVAACMD